MQVLRKAMSCTAQTILSYWFLCCFIAHKLHSNIQTSELKNTACPGILLLKNKVHSELRCFAVFILFTAPIIPQRKHIAPKGTGATDLRHTKQYFCCSDILVPRAAGSFYWASSSRNPICNGQRFPQGSSSLTKTIYGTLIKRLFWRQRLILPLYTDVKWISQF